MMTAMVDVLGGFFWGIFWEVSGVGLEIALGSWAISIDGLPSRDCDLIFREIDRFPSRDCDLIFREINRLPSRRNFGDLCRPAAAVAAAAILT
ncbi:unnamed protein product [Anisakis simplex]|uniref:Secreted protein n=1 Tax=Anisakis simplex TaxID=6269 RepID=A0A0M3J9X9_ANISI|nr:unnamed protein product [Anisakis simplex]